MVLVLLTLMPTVAITSRRRCGKLIHKKIPFAPLHLDKNLFSTTVTAFSEAHFLLFGDLSYFLWIVANHKTRSTGSTCWHWSTVILFQPEVYKTCYQSLIGDLHAGVI